MLPHLRFFLAGETFTHAIEVSLMHYSRRVRIRIYWHLVRKYQEDETWRIKLYPAIGKRYYASSIELPRRKDSPSGRMSDPPLTSSITCLAAIPHLLRLSGGWSPGWYPNSPACGYPRCAMGCLGMRVNIAFMGITSPLIRRISVSRNPHCCNLQ
jgi:hypothetical protein